MKVFRFIILIYSCMICFYDLILAWSCSYDFDTVLVMILIWCQFWFLMWVKIVIFMVFLYAISMQVEALFICACGLLRTWCFSLFYVIKCEFLNGFLFWSQPTATISKLNQNQIRIKTVSKLYQNRVKTYQNQKTLKKSTTNMSLGCFRNQPTIIKIKSYQDRIKP